MFWRKTVLLMFLLVTTFSGAYAQNRYEIEPFVGVRFGGRIHGQMILNVLAVDARNVELLEPRDHLRPREIADVYALVADATPDQVVAVYGRA